MSGSLRNRKSRQGARNDCGCPVIHRFFSASMAVVSNCTQIGSPNRTQGAAQYSGLFCISGRTSQSLSHTDWLKKQSDQPSFRPSASSKRDLSTAAALFSGTANLRLSPKLRMDFTHVSFLGGTRRNDTDSRSCMPGAETVKNGEKKMADSLAGND